MQAAYAVCPIHISDTDREVKYQVLKENKRFDLIAKYMKALTALGATTQEFDAGERIMDELDKFAAEDLAAQLDAMTEGGEEGVN